MTRDDLKTMIPVMSAWANGEKIQWRYVDRTVIPDQPWLDVSDEEPDFFNNIYNHKREWRVKPNPREWWICHNCHRAMEPYTEACKCGCSISRTLVREVL